MTLTASAAFDLWRRSKNGVLSITIGAASFCKTPNSAERRISPQRPGAGSLGTQVALQFARVPYITRRFANGVSFPAIESPVSASRKPRRLGWAPSRRVLEGKWVTACAPMLGRNDGEQNVRLYFGGNDDRYSGRRDTYDDR